MVRVTDETGKEMEQMWDDDDADDTDDEWWGKWGPNNGPRPASWPANSVQ
jgi:hypothetical protein